jgi:hypothetical protein
MTTKDKTADSNTNPGGAGNAAAKGETTALSKVAARKKQQQLKNQKPNPAAKKKQQQHVAKTTFEGIAGGIMKGIVIAQGNGNMSGQFRLFQKKLTGAAAEDKAYGLDSAIVELTAKVRSDFVKPKPDPLIHSNLIQVMGDDGVAPTGERKLVCHDPIMKEQLEAECSMDLKLQC